MELIKNNIINIDTVTVNYSDSAVSESLKLNTTGTGEKRIYIGNTKDPSDFNAFFFKSTNGVCFITRQDLQIYLRDAFYEYNFPTQDYKYNIKKLYNELVSNVSRLPEKLFISFTQTYDRQNRYYLVCERKDRKNLRILSEICLPQITKLSFVRFIDTSSNETQIQIRPFFFRIDLTGSNHPNYYLSAGLGLKESIAEEQKLQLVKPDDTEEFSPGQSSPKPNIRPWQSEWRNKVLDETMHCAVSKCSDDRILIGCHIKPVAECLKESCGNETNPKNGIMLTPTFHKLFDDGFLSFDSQNHLLLSTHISSRNYERLNLKNNQVTSILDINPRIEFLNWHRNTIFKG
jgi:putative restriction endonuclease